jgi:hypothetical protein
MSTFLLTLAFQDLFTFMVLLTSLPMSTFLLTLAFQDLFTFMVSLCCAHVVEGSAFACVSSAAGVPYKVSLMLLTSYCFLAQLLLVSCSSFLWQPIHITVVTDV